MMFSCVITTDEECDAGLDGNECCTSGCKKKILTGTCYKGIKSYRGLLSHTYKIILRGCVSEKGDNSKNENSF